MTHEQQEYVLTVKDAIQQATELKEEINALKIEMKETKTIIKQYNGLREQVDAAKLEIRDIAAKNKALIWVIGVLIPIINLAITVITLLTK